MTIVELVDANGGFQIVTNLVTTRNKRTLFVIVGVISFFFSAVLDNLTTTIVVVSLLRKLILSREDRLKFVGLTVIAANAGGAWTVIGDVTTTMLWIHHRIDATLVMKQLFIPSLVCFLVPLIGMAFSLTGALNANGENENDDASVATLSVFHQRLFFFLGLAGLLLVPVIKSVTHLPPYMGMMLSLSVLWIVSECVGRDLDTRMRTKTGVRAALRKVDMSSVLFFLGILLAVGALSSTGLLGSLAAWLDTAVPNRDWVAVAIGLLSSLVDNVPLVAAGIEMYEMPLNDHFWMMLAYCAGTGGSCLIIGSAAGVAAMGMEQVGFGWYLKNIAPWALAGFFAGALILLLN